MHISASESDMSFKAHRLRFKTRGAAFIMAVVAVGCGLAAGALGNDAASAVDSAQRTPIAQLGYASVDRRIPTAAAFGLSDNSLTSDQRIGRRAAGTQDPLVDVPITSRSSNGFFDVNADEIPRGTWTLVATFRDDHGRDFTASIDIPGSPTIDLVPTTRKFSVASGQALPVTGIARTRNGATAGGVAIHVDRTERGGAPAPCGDGVTAADGRFEVACPIRVSGDVIVSAPDSTGLPTSPRVTARPLVTLAADRPVRRRGTVSVLTGALSPSPAELATYGLRTPVPVTKRIVLEVAPGGSRTFRIVRVAATNPAGQFTIRYRWPTRRGPDGLVRLRVRVAAERPWPLAEGLSKAVVVTVSRPS